MRKRDRDMRKRGRNVVQCEKTEGKTPRERERERERENRNLERGNARHAIYAVPINHPAVNFCTDSRHRLPRVGDRRGGLRF